MANSSFGKLNVRDVLGGIAAAIVVVVLGALQQAVTNHGFDVMSYDWTNILDIAWKTAGAYLATNVFTTKEGKFLGAVRIKDGESWKRLP